MIVGHFNKVSFEQFKDGIKYACDKIDNYIIKEYLNTPDEKVREIYDNIKLPQRATARSAGYDFYYPFGETLLIPGESIVIPTGINVRIYDDIDFDCFLAIYTKSSHGFYNRIKQEDTVAIIDADYINSNNEGHIFLDIRNEHRTKTFKMKYHEKIAQGVFQIYGITSDDNATASRNGGMGSTSI